MGRTGSRTSLVLGSDLGVFSPRLHFTFLLKLQLSVTGLLPSKGGAEVKGSESRAISRYILRKYKSDLLRENDLKEAALVDAWLDVENGQYNAPCSAIIYNAIVKPMLGEVVDQQVVDTNLEKLKKVLDVYESRLSQCKYLAGDVISFADLSHVPCTYCIMLTQYGSVFDSYPHVKAWWETIMARPSVRKPFGQIPTFQDDDFIIFESRAISKYILKKYKSDVLPEDDLKKATLVDVWLDVEYGQYNTPISTIVYEVIFKQTTGSTSDQMIVDASLKNLKQVLEVYEAYGCHSASTWPETSSVWLISAISHYTYYFMGTQYGSLFDSYPHVKA
ncbi:hypothetical protein FCM35_KLT10801 [Carex littledalei]|uniref:glutathione transferase n=1 Tax=Carex littledalei TaxID=544730 RepID=A0A833VHY4_9POAL|nr:hypothetical protein FCM35_KLT10801 [Carex littledalei]